MEFCMGEGLDRIPVLWRTIDLQRALKYAHYCIHFLFASMVSHNYLHNY